MQSVYCVVQTGSLNKAVCASSLKCLYNTGNLIFTAKVGHVVMEWRNQLVFHANVVKI
jgi:hypothetical protein